MSADDSILGPVEKPWHLKTIEEKFNIITNKYKCECKSAQYHQGNCIDCLNNGYIYDNDEISLIVEMNDEIQRLKKGHYVLNEALGQTGDDLDKLRTRNDILRSQKKELDQQLTEKEARERKLIEGLAFYGNKKNYKDNTGYQSPPESTIINWELKDSEEFPDRMYGGKRAREILREMVIL